MSDSALQTVLSLRSHLASTLFSTQAYYHLTEALFFLLVVYLALTTAYKPWARNPAPVLTPQQQAQKIAAWKPAPLAPPLTDAEKSALPLDLIISSAGSGPVIRLQGYDCPVTNFATTNFLGLLKHPHIEQAALDTMREYGCGACGPRGFYGTTDLHLKCEQRIANFCNTPNAILYSFGAATGNSTIPAFCKRGDLVVVDDAVNYTLELGVRLSRAEVIRFRHNDMSHLEQVLADVVTSDAKHPSRKRTQRRMIIVEALYQNVGDVCPLDTVVGLKDKYRFRLLLDESFSFGVLGATGRGALEEFSIDRSLVDIATADLGNAVASVGGFCVGSDDIVDHQRLSGAGYCFSASQPPFLARAATTAIDLVATDGARLTKKLRTNIASFFTSLDRHALKHAGWYLDGDQRSPIVHVRAYDDTLPEPRFTQIQKHCLDAGVLFSRPLYVADEPAMPKPSIRVAISAGHSRQQIEQAAATLQSVLLAPNAS